MFRKTITTAVIAATLSMFGTATAASARDHWRGGGWDRGDRGYGERYYGGGRDYGRNYYGDGRGYYRESYRGSRCRGNGTTGTIVGAIAGGLLGNSVAGRGDRTLGTVLGGGVGALAGRAIDRGDDRC